MWADEEAVIKVLFGIIIVLIFGYFLMYFSMYSLFESKSIMCPYCQRIYKIKYATDVNLGPPAPAPSILPPVIRK